MPVKCHQTPGWIEALFSPGLVTTAVPSSSSSRRSAAPAGHGQGRGKRADPVQQLALAWNSSDTCPRAQLPPRANEVPPSTRQSTEEARGMELSGPRRGQPGDRALHTTSPACVRKAEAWDGSPERRPHGCPDGEAQRSQGPVCWTTALLLPRRQNAHFLAHSPKARGGTGSDRARCWLRCNRKHLSVCFPACGVHLPAGFSPG